MVSPAKDVEGLNSNHLHSIYRKDHSLDSLTILEQSVIPCTPLAIVKILEHLRIYTPVLSPGSRLLGKTITVINRSEVNGRPLAALLANDGASVYSVDLTGVQLFKAMGTCRAHHEVYEKPGWTLEDVLPLSGIVISGVPSKDFQVPSDLLREGAVCINFSSFYNFNRASIKERASVYVPSVGKVTVVMLLKNLTVSTSSPPHGPVSHPFWILWLIGASPAAHCKQTASGYRSRSRLVKEWKVENWSRNLRTLNRVLFSMWCMLFLTNTAVSRI